MIADVRISYPLTWSSRCSSTQARLPWRRLRGEAPRPSRPLATVRRRSADRRSRRRPCQAQATAAVRSPRARFHKLVDPGIDALWTGYDRDRGDGSRRVHQPVLAAGRESRLQRDRRSHSGAARRAAGLIVTSSRGVSDGGPAWDHSAARWRSSGTAQPDEVVLSREKDRLTLCINSFSTPDGGIVAPLVDVGRGDRDEDYAGKDLKGAVVLGDADAGALWRRAVVDRRRASASCRRRCRRISTPIRRAPPGRRRATSGTSCSGAACRTTRRARPLGSRRHRAPPPTLRKRLAAAGRRAGDAVRVNIASIVHDRTRADAGRRNSRRHRCQPSASSWPRTCRSRAPTTTPAASRRWPRLAVAMATRFEQKKIAAPARTITFLFLNEISGSRRWMQDHPADAKQVKYMFSLDMTGEDVAKTGGSFLVERYPDPGAVWERPWDPHSEWGKGNVRAESLKGDLINDTHLAVLRARRAARAKWVVKTNPYEGGSDHTVFGRPACRRCSTGTSPIATTTRTSTRRTRRAPRRCGTSASRVGATAWLLASADAEHRDRRRDDRGVRRAERSRSQLEQTRRREARCRGARSGCSAKPARRRSSRPGGSGTAKRFGARSRLVDRTRASSSFEMSCNG